MMRLLGLIAAFTAGLIGALAGGTADARAEDDGIISIGWTAWADAEAVSKLAAIIIGQGMKKSVELTLSDIDGDALMPGCTRVDDGARMNQLRISPTDR